jgi:replicative DNA helicase
MKLSAPIFRLKRRAKVMSREAQIPLTEALNRVAADEGFGSWSLLAARYAKRDPAPIILARLEPGDMVLVGARPMQGKTMLAMNILAEASKSGHPCAYFTLEHTTTEAVEIMRFVGLDATSANVLLDASDAICADYMIGKLKGAKAGAVVLVDYLQALDHHRETPPLADQISALKKFADEAGLIFIFISQIDRHYDSATKALPDISDVRMPNKVDASLFSKTCFLREGEVIFGGAGIAT